jgi:SAM-dependent methyltransferase
VTAERDLRKSVQHNYARAGPIWDPADNWHSRVHDEIQAAVGRFNRKHAAPSGVVLDVGSGGRPQAIPYGTYIQVDLVATRLIGQSMAVSADAHALPFPDNLADRVLCVGPVVNYCSLIEVMAELSRVCKPGGFALLHVELSNSLEYLFTPHWRAAATIVKTQFRGAESQWMYSHRILLQTLENAGFKVLDAHYFMTLAALANRAGLTRKAARRFARFDALLNRLPGVGEIADSVILTCAKPI